MSNVVLLPILLPLIGAVACLFRRRSLRFQQVVSGAVSLALPLACLALLLEVRSEGTQVLRLGSWPGAFGIVLAVDLFGAMLMAVSATVQATTWWFLVAGGVERDQESFLMHPLLLLLGAGVNWAFSTGDLFNLFVSFEIILLASYVLISHGNERSQLRESIKFVVLNIIASALFLLGAGYTYGVFGSLNFAELAVRFAQAGYPPESRVLGTLFLVVFGMKAAVFPLFFWLPDAYPKAPRGVLALFAGVLTKIGVYCLYRIFTLLFRDPVAFQEWFQPLILGIAGLTMIIGVLCAFGQYSFRRILAFHIVSQIGYMVFALGIFTPLALAAGIFFIVHQIAVKAALFLVGDAVAVNVGSEELKKISGVAHLSPWLAMLFLLAAFSLAGFPPLSGFYGKYGLVVEGLAGGHGFIVAVSLVTSVFTLASMMKIWRYAFWGERHEGMPERPVNVGVIAATGGLVAVTLVIAVASGWVMALSVESATQMLDRADYVGAVLGERGVEALRAATSSGLLEVAEVQP